MIPYLEENDSPLTLHVCALYEYVNNLCKIRCDMFTNNKACMLGILWVMYFVFLQHLYSYHFFFNYYIVVSYHMILICHIFLKDINCNN